MKLTTGSRRLAATVLAAGTVAACLTFPTSGLAQVRDGEPGRVVWQDEFDKTFSYQGDDARWRLSPVGTFPHGDVTPSVRNGVLTMVPTGTNPVTGRPAFRYTTPQQGAGGGGDLDQPKWVALPNHTAGTGYRGFDALPGHVLTCQTQLSARTFGTHDHPFGAAVSDPDSDLRLAAPAMVALDPESYSAFDFVVTNTTIYAIYERLKDPGTTPAGFTYAVPVARRLPGQAHLLELSLDRSAGVLEWKVDRRVALRVDRIGHRALDRKHLMIDHGGVESTISPRQLACGMGMFTFLAGSLGGQGLVRVSDAPGYYFDPRRGEPVPQTFVDELSLDHNRLWGQGAQLDINRVTVISTPKP